MTGIGRTRRIGKVLAAGALIGLAGCQHTPSRPGGPTALGWDNGSKSAGPITPAQEADVQISMGRAAEQQGDLDQAMAAYRAALTRDNRRADAYARLAVLHDKQGKFREAAALYRKALAAQPGNPDTFCDMGYSFYLQRRWAEAEMNLRQAIALNPDHQRAHNNLALLLVRDNRLADALAEFRKGGSDPARSHMNLAFALTMDQRWEPARAEYQRALALEPSSPVAKARLDQLNALIAKREPARDRTPRDPGVLTTSRAADPPPPRRPDRGTPAPPASASASASTRPPARRDPRLVNTSASRPAPARRLAAPVAMPRVPAEGDATRKLWAAADSPNGPPPRRPPDPRTGAPTAPPQKRASQPQRAAPRSDDRPARPLPAT